MGTTVSIDVREPFTTDAALDDAIAWFHDVDRRSPPGSWRAVIAVIVDPSTVISTWTGP